VDSRTGLLLWRPALLLRKTPSLKLLCDRSQALDGWNELCEWVSASYLPQLTHTGICVIAWLNAADWQTNDTITAFILPDDPKINHLHRYRSFKPYRYHKS